MLCGYYGAGSSDVWVLSSSVIVTMGRVLVRRSHDLLFSVPDIQSMGEALVSILSLTIGLVGFYSAAIGFFLTIDCRKYAFTIL